MNLNFSKVFIIETCGKVGNSWKTIQKHKEIPLSLIFLSLDVAISRHRDMNFNFSPPRKERKEKVKNENRLKRLKLFNTDITSQTIF